MDACTDRDALQHRFVAVVADPTVLFCSAMVVISTFTVRLGRVSPTNSSGLDGSISTDPVDPSSCPLPAPVSGRGASWDVASHRPPPLSRPVRDPSLSTPSGARHATTPLASACGPPLPRLRAPIGRR